jgi:dethiobiotin synthetase
VNQVWIVTGTDTGVGKTVVTAAVAACAAAGGRRVAVLKPGESGVAPGSGQETDGETVRRLAGPTTTLTLASYPEALAPLAAAEESGLPAVGIGDVIEAVGRLGAGHEEVLIEGAGGLLVPMGAGGWTMADLAVALRCPVIVVARPGLGTLNHTALTLEALARRGLTGYVVIGSWPAQPALVHWRNLADLGGELVGVLPEAVGGLAAAEFRERAPGWLTPMLYGRADPLRLRRDGVAGPPPPWPT